MATIMGGLSQLQPSPGTVTPTPSASAGKLSLASVTDAHTTIAGGQDTGSGFDTVNTPQNSDGGFSGGAGTGTETVVATQTQQGSNTILHLSDGSTLTLVGTTHIDVTFFH